MKTQTVFFLLVGFIVLFHIPLWFMMDIQSDDPYATNIAKQQQQHQASRRGRDNRRTSAPLSFDSSKWRTPPSVSLKLQRASGDSVPPSPQIGEREDLASLLSSVKSALVSSKDDTNSDGQQNVLLSSAASSRDFTTSPRRLVELLTEEDEAEIELSRWWLAPVPRPSFRYRITGPLLHADDFAENDGTRVQLLLVMCISGRKSLLVAKRLLQLQQQQKEQQQEKEKPSARLNDDDDHSAIGLLLLLVPSQAPHLLAAAKRLREASPFAFATVWSVEQPDGVYGVNAWSLLPMISAQALESHAMASDCVAFLGPGLIDIEPGTIAALSSRCRTGRTRRFMRKKDVKQSNQRGEAEEEVIVSETIVGCSPVSSATIESFDTRPDVASRFHFGQGLNAHLGSLAQIIVDERLAGVSFRDRRTRAALNRRISGKNNRSASATNDDGSSGKSSRDDASSGLVVVDDLDGTENLASPSPFCFAATPSTILQHWPAADALLMRSNLAEEIERSRQRDNARAAASNNKNNNNGDDDDHFPIFSTPGSFLAPPMFPLSMIRAQSASPSLVFLPIHIDTLSFLLNAAGAAFWRAPSKPAVEIIASQITFFGPANWSPDFSSNIRGSDKSNNNNNGDDSDSSSAREKSSNWMQMGVVALTTDAGVLAPELFERVSVAALARVMHIAKLPSSWWPGKVRQFALAASRGKLGQKHPLHQQHKKGNNNDNNNNNNNGDGSASSNEGFFSRLFHGAAKIRFGNEQNGRRDSDDDDAGRRRRIKRDLIAAAPSPAIVWDTFCVPCFGWTSEVMGYAVGLEGHIPLRLMQGPECFCPGTPRWVRRSLTRLAKKKYFQVASPDQLEKQQQEDLQLQQQQQQQKQPGTERQSPFAQAEEHEKRGDEEHADDHHHDDDHDHDLVDEHHHDYQQQQQPELLDDAQQPRFDAVVSNRGPRSLAIYDASQQQQQQQHSFHSVASGGHLDNNDNNRKKKMALRRAAAPFQHRDEHFIIVVIHKDPGSLPSYIGDGAVFSLYRKPDAVVARSMFELTRVTDGNWRTPTYVDELWVPSRFVRWIFERAGEARFPAEKLVVVPEPVDVFYYDPLCIEPLEMPPVMQQWKRDSTRMRPSSSSSSAGDVGDTVKSSGSKSNSALSRNFKFFSAGKWESRKGLDVLVEALMREFRPEEKVSLYISSYLYGDDTRDPGKLMQFVKEIAEKIEKEREEQNVDDKNKNNNNDDQNDANNAASSSSSSSSSARDAVTAENKRQEDVADAAAAARRRRSRKPLFSAAPPGWRVGGDKKFKLNRHRDDVIGGEGGFLRRHQKQIADRDRMRKSNGDTQHWKSRVPHIEIITERLPEADLLSLYRSVDCFVLPTRGEGWGLPTIQAMSLGLPVISTNWSGSVDFTTPDTCYLLPVEKLENVDKSTNNDDNEHAAQWAVPSMTELRKLMRHVFTYPLEGKAKGAKARNHIADQYSLEGIAELVVERAEVLRNRAVFGSDDGPVIAVDKKNEEEKQHVSELLEEAGHLIG